MSRAARDRQAVANEVFVSAPIIYINCIYDVNEQVPSCFIKSPERCQVTILYRSGVLLQKT